MLFLLLLTLYWSPTDCYSLWTDHFSSQLSYVDYVSLILSIFYNSFMAFYGTWLVVVIYCLSLYFSPLLFYAITASVLCPQLACCVLITLSSCSNLWDFFEDVESLCEYLPQSKWTPDLGWKSIDLHNKRTRVSFIPPIQEQDYPSPLKIFPQRPKKVFWVPNNLEDLETLQTIQNPLDLATIPQRQLLTRPSTPLDLPSSSKRVLGHQYICSQSSILALTIQGHHLPSTLNFPT